MRIECQTCNTRFKLDENLVKNEGTKVRCSKCKDVITVYPQEEKQAGSEPVSKSSNKTANTIHEAQAPPNNDSSNAPVLSENQNNSPRLMIMITILALVCSGSIAFHSKYLDIFSVVLISCLIFAVLWPQLRNLFASIWLNIYTPFHIGDLICIGSQAQGYVVQKNLNRTSLRTDAMAIVSIPNAELINHTICNYSIHPESFPLSCDVQVDVQNPPNRVRKILLDAALPVKGVSSNLAPFTKIKGLSSGLSHYTLMFYLDDIDNQLMVMEEIWDRIWQLFKRAGILPFVPEGQRDTDDEESSESILNEVDIFRPFTDYAKSYMTKNMNRREFKPGIHVFHQGDEGNSLYIIEEGVVGVQVEITPGKSIEVARLGAGSFFGEMALLTGEARTANIIAISDTVLFEITREHIAPLIDEQPQISKSLSELLVQRKIETEAKKNKYRAEKLNRKALKKQIMDQIDTYFKSQ